MMTHQEIFDAKYKTLQEEAGPDDNGYGTLVYALQETFEQAGFAITGSELAGQFHSQIVMMIGQTDLTQIARGFISAFTVGRKDWPHFSLRNIVAGECGWGYRVYQSPSISFTTSYDEQIDRELKKKSIRRGSKAYTAFCAEHADNVAVKMRHDAQQAVEAKQQELEQEIERLKAENEKGIAAANHLRRAVYIIRAFMKISNATDEWDVLPELEQRANLLERGVEARRSNMFKTTQHLERTDLDQLVTLSVENTKDAKKIWAARSQPELEKS